MPLDVLKTVYTFDITGETDHGIEQCPAFWSIGFQHSIKLFDINGTAVLTLFFIVFYEEIIVVVNLKVYQRIENDIVEAKIIYEPSVFIFKAMLDIFYIFNGPLMCLDEFALTFGIKSEEN